MSKQAISQELKYDDITPSHVYQATSDLISEIEILREAMGVTVYPVEAELQEDRAPVHVYSKSLEVMEKIAAAQSVSVLSQPGSDRFPSRISSRETSSRACRTVSPRFAG